MARNSQTNRVNAPGETMRDILNEKKISERDFAWKMDMFEGEAQGLLDGRTSITMKIAQNLQRVLGATVEFWRTRDANYWKSKQ